MKRFVCICLVLVLGLTVCGCQEKISQPEALPRLSADEMTVEKVAGDLRGAISMILSPDVLELKLNGTPHTEKYGEKVYVVTKDADDWCYGDEVTVSYSQVQYPKDTTQYVRIIADKVQAARPMMYKPIIYFYPEKPTVCSAKVTLNGHFTCTYPNHGENGWENFTAYPDGTLVFPDGKEYYALYWEGEQAAQWDFSEGFCVKGENTAAFLEWALAEQGLTAREANEFIVYWLPLMQDNSYNVISFQTKAYTDGAILEITPTPDSLLRIFMTYYPSDVEVEIAPQTFDIFVRSGFTVVEWGGSPV